MMRRILFLLLLLFAVIINAHSTDILQEDDENFGEESGSTWSSGDAEKEYELGVQWEEALEKLQKVFGIQGQSDRSTRHKTPPQFMMELYNTIADPSGVTRGKNPYNAKVVRSFIERDSSLSHFYLFNISGLEMNESVLEAELHLYRKRTPLKAIHPAILSSPFYLIRVYQVLDERSLDVPDLHRLLNIHYVGAHASGWQVFNVKQAVLSWISGTPNLGLLVTASTIFGDEVSVDFSRRNEYHHSKQPILVLFDDDGKEHSAGENIVPHYYKYDNDLEDEDDLSYKDQDKIDLQDEYDREQFKRHKRHKGELDRKRIKEQEDDKKKAEEEEEKKQRKYHEFESDSGLFRRQKRHYKNNDEEVQKELLENEILSFLMNITDEFKDVRIPGVLKHLLTSKSYKRYTRDTNFSKKITKKKQTIVSDKTKVTEVLNSMDIYERAALREKITDKHNESSETRVEIAQNRHKRSTRKRTHAHSQPNATECVRHELYVDFEEIGWSSSIIAPKGYSAYHCKGHCNFPLSQNQRPTNHATVQSIVHKLGLAKGVEQPCCVPTKLLSASILYFDDNDNVILKMYEDMIADRCGCH